MFLWRAIRRKSKNRTELGRKWLLTVPATIARRKSQEHFFWEGIYPLEVHVQAPFRRAGIVFSRISRSTSASGTRTARESFTWANFLFAIQSLTVAGFTPNR